MRKYIFIILLCFSAASMAQNVGIGTSTPTEKLDVTGNINVEGNIKLNNVGGQPGQILMTNNNGSSQWVDLTQYKNLANLSYFSPSWTVPAGVTKLYVELWGGGGGGSKDAGAGAGGYIMALINVTPGDVLPYSIGTGGLGGGTSGADGTNSSFTFGTVALYAIGGEGAVTNGINVNYGSGGYYDVGGTVFRSFFGINGESGSSNKLEYSQKSSTEFVKITSGGDGGNSPNVPNTGGKGRTMVVNTSDQTYVLLTKTTPGTKPGGGGGGGFDNGSFGTGGTGGIGMILVHY